MSNEQIIQLEINDQPIQAAAGQMLIDVADANGIDIPRFCYHKKLSVAANCRMCLVDIENTPKPMPACATPVTDGMKVSTKSEKARASQKSVMEFLLINHPLDCPICDQGGECDLQDLAVTYGQDFSRFAEKKRVVKDKNLGPLVSTDMTRCIHCTRCVRFGKEIAGVVEMGGLGRGEHMEIGTYVEKSLSSELSGNIIDLCPVGALTSKPFRFQARSWEMTTTASIAPHDALGSNIVVQSIQGEVKRVLPDENEALNEIWLSDRDRFSYLGLRTEDRVTTPLVRNKQGELAPVSWQNAFDIAAAKLGEAEVVNALASPNSTTEELYLLQQLVAGLGKGEASSQLRHSENIRIASHMDGSVADISQSDAVLVVASDIQREVPLLSHRINKAYRAGASVDVLNPQAYTFNFSPASQTHSAEEMLASLAGVAKQLGVGEAKADNNAQAIAKRLKAAKKPVVLLGQLAATSDAFDALYSVTQAIAKATDAQFVFVDMGANSTGAMLAGLNQSGKRMKRLAKSANALLLFGTELSQDSGAEMSDVLSQTDFVVSCATYLDPDSAAHADLVLPIANFSETSGTFVNIQGDWQSFTGAVAPLGEARPGWKVLRVLANHLALAGFDFNSSEEVLAACKAAAVELVSDLGVVDTLPESCRSNVADIYATDALVRRSAALQGTVLGGQS